MLQFMVTSARRNPRNLWISEKLDDSASICHLAQTPRNACRAAGIAACAGRACRFAYGRYNRAERERGGEVRVSYHEDASLEEDRIDVCYREENEQIEIIRNFFSTMQSITGRKDGEVCVLHPGSIYYLEMVDRKLFAYQAKEVYQLDYSMRRFLDCFGGEGFVQIGKSTVVNLYRVRRVRTDLNMRLKLAMDNGEALILNRTYKKSFLDALYHMEEMRYEND